MIMLLYQIFSVKPDQADTYKCFATNEYGKAVCTATLNVNTGKDYYNMFVVNIKYYSLYYSFMVSCFAIVFIFLAVGFKKKGHAGMNLLEL